jgi:hypothetical protein
MLSLTGLPKKYLPHFKRILNEMFWVEKLRQQSLLLNACLPIAEN